VIGLTLLWVYLRRHERFSRFRNTILLANIIGLDRLRVMPTAPPWMFPDQGSSTASTTRARFCRRSGTRTPRCRACTPRTR
jgi:hypothetical protein